MNQDSHFQRLREAGWRRALTAAESDEMRNWLLSHPEQDGDWESDQQITKVLRELRDVPLASNFTAQVLQGLEQEDLRITRQNRGGSRFLSLLRTGWIPKLAWGLLIVGSSIAIVHHVQFEARQELARSIASLAEIPRPKPDVLLDFDAIHLMSKASTPDLAAAPDSELLSLLK
jgi:hypothetical protein